jgi:anti-sigma-K factor RskA
MIKEGAERRRIESLLPWYAAGTLSRGDADRVEQALASDIGLARSYALVLEELAETINLNEALGEPSASVAETLFAAIDVEEALNRSTPNTALSAGASWPTDLVREAVEREITRREKAREKSKIV